MLKSAKECVSEFISFITGEACEKCLAERRKTINGDDLLHAMQTSEFEKYLEPLRLYLRKYREVTKGERGEENGLPSMIFPENSHSMKEDKE